MSGWLAFPSSLFPSLLFPAPFLHCSRCSVLTVLLLWRPALRHRVWGFGSFGLWVALFNVRFSVPPARVYQCFIRSVGVISTIFTFLKLNLNSDPLFLFVQDGERLAREVWPFQPVLYTANRCPLRRRGSSLKGRAFQSTHLSSVNIVSKP